MPQPPLSDLGQSLARAAWIEVGAGRTCFPPSTSTSSSPCRRPVAEIAARNKAVVYGLLFRAVAETLRTIAADPRHLGAEHRLLRRPPHLGPDARPSDPHLHCVIPGGGPRKRPAAAGFPAAPASSCRSGSSRASFRRVLLQALQDAFESGQLRFEADAGCSPSATPGVSPSTSARPARPNGWSTRSHPSPAPNRSSTTSAAIPTASPSATSACGSLDDGSVRFRYTALPPGRRVPPEDHATLTATEFIRRMLLHVLPPGFHRIRYYGFLANRARPDRSSPSARRLRARARPPPTLGRARRLRHNRLSRALRGADRSLVAAVSIRCDDTSGLCRCRRGRRC